MRQVERVPYSYFPEIRCEWRKGSYIQINVESERIDPFLAHLMFKVTEYLVLDSSQAAIHCVWSTAGMRPFCRDTLYKFNELIEYRTSI